MFSKLCIQNIRRTSGSGSMAFSRRMFMNQNRITNFIQSRSGLLQHNNVFA